MTAFIMSCFLLLVWSFVLGRGALVKVVDITPPVCRMINSSLDCPLPCDGAMWNVTFLVTDGNGSGIDGYKESVILDRPIKEPSVVVWNNAQDENGYNATLMTYSASCCKNKVELSVRDKKGIEGRCNFSIRWPSTTATPQTTNRRSKKLFNSFSNSPRISPHLLTTTAQILYCTFSVLYMF